MDSQDGVGGETANFQGGGAYEAVDDGFYFSFAATFLIFRHLLDLAIFLALVPMLSLKTLPLDGSYITSDLFIGLHTADCRRRHTGYSLTLILRYGSTGNRKSGGRLD